MNATSELSRDLTTPLLAPGLLNSFDALADGRCSLAEFSRSVLEHCRGDESAATGVLVLLEECGSFGNLKQHDFGPLQRALRRQHATAGERTEPTLLAIDDTVDAGPRPARGEQPKTVLCGRFVLQEIIGRGGVGTVYRAHDRNRAGLPREHQYIALKVLRSEHAHRPEALRAFRREFHQAQSLSHPGIVNVYDFAHDGGIHFVTMELLDGESLGALMKRVVPRDRTREAAIRLLCDLGEAIAFAHEHDVVHMDLKPGNVFVTTQGSIRVLDFGLAHTFMAEPWISDAPPESPAATMAYASCERLVGDLPDVRDDLYSFACMAYELLSGRHPFERRSALEARNEGRGPRRIRGLSRRQWRALKSALAWSRADRPASMRELLQDFAPRTATARHGNRSQVRTRRTSPAAQLSVALLLLAVALGLGWNQLPGETRQEVIARTAALGQASRDTLDAARSWINDRWFASALTAEQAMPPAAQPEREAVPASEAAVPADTAAVSEPAVSELESPTPVPAPTDQTMAPPIVEPAPAVVAAAAVEPPRPAGGPGVLEFRSEAYSVDESEATARVTVRRRGGATGEISFGWRTVDDSAVAGEDYAPASARAVMVDGQVTATLLVPIVADSSVEHIEIFDVVIEEPTGAQLGELTSIPVIIVDDD